MNAKCYKLYATGSASANAAAQLIIQRKGVLIGAQFAFALDSVTDNSLIAIELSLASVAQTSTNDSVGPICEVREHYNFVTSGFHGGGINFTCPLALQIDEGTRLYMNVQLATITFTGSIYVWATQ